MTAAHCCEEKNFLETTKVFLGNNKLDYYYRNAMLGYKIEKVFIHPNWNGNESDIALLKLKRPVMINNLSVKPACLLDENNKPRPYEFLMASGFGRTFDSRKEGILQKSKKLDDISFDEYNRIKNETLIRTKGTGNPATATCWGDSGMLCLELLNLNIYLNKI